MEGHRIGLSYYPCLPSHNDKNLDKINLPLIVHNIIEGHNFTLCLV